jgi:formylglycine-generating enzyme required for sulfatase activity/predicted Ser/Thr protein kinase
MDPVSPVFDPHTSAGQPNGLPASGSRVAGDYPMFASPDRPGDLGRLGPYRIEHQLGKGGMGFVFRAVDENLLRRVALKVMSPDFAAIPTNRARFRREAQAAAAVRSEHVVGIHHVGELDDIPFLVMELLEGDDLEKWLKNRDPAAVSAADVVRVAEGMLAGLAAIHEKGLIHRDIKPSNLWLEEPSGRVKLLDFGLTRGAESNVTGVGLAVGTPSYMAPEQSKGEPIDARADLFSAGVVLYEIISGGNPFRQSTAHRTYAALEELVPESAASYRRVPPELAALIDQMMAKRPGDRPASSAAALDVVRRVERQLRAAAFVPPLTAAYEPPEPPEPPPPPAEPPTSSLPVTVVPRALSDTEQAVDIQFWAGGELRPGRCRVIELDLGSGARMEFVRVPAGEYLRGAADDEPLAEDDEKPQRVVRIGRDFFIGRYAVTQEQYLAVVGEASAHARGEKLPVHGVSWEEARSFCAKVSERTRRTVELPTEAEWEYACRAGTTTPFHFGTVVDGTLANCDVPGAPPRRVGAVDQHPPNEWGLCGMHGNVWEWCRDYYGPYDKVKEQTDPVQAMRQSEDCRVLRGGSWESEARLCRAATRIRNTPRARGRSYGFRVCLRLEL